MADRDTFFGKDPEKAHQFLDACLPQEGIQSSPDTSDPGYWLDKYLSETLEDSQNNVDDNSSTLIDEIQSQIIQTQTSTIEELLLNPTTSIITIQQIKDAYKQKHEHAQTKPEQKAATATYFATIAHGLVHYLMKISDHNDNYLQKSFTWLLKQTWITPELTNLYEKAIDINTKP